MKKLHVFSLFIASLIAVVSVLHCATVKAVGPKVVHLAAEDCVELSQGDVKKVCATVDELVPLLDLILSARQSGSKKAAIDGGTD